MSRQPAWQIKRCGAFLNEQGETQWRVWAPKAKRVDLVLVDSEHHRVRQMTPEGEGYYWLALPDIAEGQRYAYRLDKGVWRPDPYSRWQPSGVHQPSAVVHTERFTWTHPTFQPPPLKDLVFYELHVGTFTPEGTFDAIIPRLASLRELGVAAIELLPIAQFPGERNWGYDGVHLFAPQNTYGDPHSLARLVDAAHAEGLAIFLDVVYNHFGPEGNYVGEFGPYYSYRYNTTWGPAFNFDAHHCDPVRQFVLDNVAQWIGDYRFDGLRLDAVHAMYDTSPDHILSEIKQVADDVAAQRGSRAYIVAESLLNDVRMVLPRERGGYNLDAEWNEDFHHAVLAYLTGDRHGKYVDFGPIDHIPRVLNETFLLTGSYSHFRGRRWGRPVGDLSGERFVIGIQNHDHVGNRAVGERLAALVSPAAQRMAASLMLLSPHLPLLFMGEEYGEENPFLFFCSFGDRQLIENVRNGRKRDYELVGHVPDPQDPSSFTASKLSWSWPEGSSRAGLRRLYQHLLRARREWPALQDTVLRHAKLLADENSRGVLQLVRGGAEPSDATTLVAYINLADKPQAFPKPAGKTRLFSSEATIYQAASAVASPDTDYLAPFECLVFGPHDFAPLV